MTLTQQDLQKLTHDMPELHFIPALDCDWQKIPLVQTYLNHYGINFGEQFASVFHGFGYVTAAGFQLATHYWLPANPKGTLIIVHGYYDHTGIFGQPIRFALEQNLAVLAFDLPGHGLSTGEQAVIDSFDQYGDGLAEILRASAAIMPQPLYVLGQSTGCAIFLNYLWRYSAKKTNADEFAKIVLCSPLVLPRTWRGRYMGQHVYAILHHFVNRITRNFSENSHDATFLEFIQKDPLQAKHLSLRWLGAMKAWHKTFLNLYPLQKELLIVQGTNDMTVDWRYNIPLIQKKLPRAKIVYINDAGHQLVNESDDYRVPVFAAIKHYFFN